MIVIQFKIPELRINFEEVFSLLISSCCSNNIIDMRSLLNLKKDQYTMKIFNLPLKLKNNDVDSTFIRSDGLLVNYCFWIEWWLVVVSSPKLPLI